MSGQHRGSLGWGAGHAQAGTAGVRGRWAWRAGRRRQAAAARERSGRVGVRGSWAQAQVGGRALGARQGAGRAAGRWARGRQGAGLAAGRRWARGARAAWAVGLALGSALGALGPFSIRFDSFFFPESPNEHCSL